MSLFCIGYFFHCRLGKVQSPIENFVVLLFLFLIFRSLVNGSQHKLLPRRNLELVLVAKSFSAVHDFEKQTWDDVEYEHQESGY